MTTASVDAHCKVRLLACEASKAAMTLAARPKPIVLVGARARVAARSRAAQARQRRHVDGPECLQMLSVSEVCPSWPVTPDPAADGRVHSPVDFPARRHCKPKPTEEPCPRQISRNIRERRRFAIPLKAYLILDCQEPALCRMPLESSEALFCAPAAHWAVKAFARHDGTRHAHAARRQIDAIAHDAIDTGWANTHARWVGVAPSACLAGDGRHIRPRRCDSHLDAARR
mmetsp:Transcript_53277/g.147187  ORF Transcript_53277/g.147187 Transcript_53277/m.147187 type:complete len:229 (+) Transcript_53277:1668-2354(+)